MFLPQRSQRTQSNRWKLQIASCKLRVANWGVFILQFTFCILHFAILVLVSPNRCAYGNDGAIAAVDPQVVPVDGAAFAGKLVSVSADGTATFQAAEKGNVDTIKLGDLVRWGNPAPLKPQTVVVLAEGGRIVTAADWSGGSAVRLDGDNVVILSDTWNEIRLPRRAVSGIVFAQRSQAAARERLIERVRAFGKTGGAANRTADNVGDSGDAEVWLTNGNRVSGTISKLEKGSLAVRASAGETTLPLSRVEAIAWNKNGRPTIVPAENKFLVGMRDGSLVLAKSLTATEKEVAIELVGNITIKGGSVADIVLLQSLGGRFEYLSAIEKLDYRFVPYLTLEWPLERDRNVLGGPFEVNGERYLKGLGLHSAARVTYPFEHDYQRFDASVAVDDAAKHRGSVMFGVHVLRDGKWVEAFTSDVMRGSERPRQVSVDLHGVKGLTLTVDYADRGDELDYADLLDARLVK